jgi:hypothetical protein
MSNPIRKFNDPDDPSSAPESGDPADAGRSRGQVVEPDEVEQNVRDDSDGTGEEFESGRQDAAPRAGC